MDISVAFPCTYVQEREDWRRDKTATFTVKVRGQVYDKESQERKWENKYIDVKTFSQLGDRVREKFVKGSVIFVRGRLEDIRAYTTDAGPKAAITVFADDIVAAPKDFSEENGETEVEEDSQPTGETPVARRPPPPPPAAATSRGGF